MKYSGIIELVGIRELATVSPGDYIQKIREFRFAIENSYNKDTLTHVHIFRDSCYIEDKSLEQLIKFIRAVQTNLLLRSNLVIRGAIGKGNLLLTPIQSESMQLSDKIKGFECSSIASQLYGYMERLKGIGIYVDLPIIADIPENLKNTFFKNCFITENRYQKYVEFNDLALDPQFMTESNLGKLLILLSKARFFSKKIARFYVPILINWAKSVDLGPRDEEGLDLDDYVVKRQVLEKCRDILGIELVFLALMDRAFSFNADSDISSSSLDADRINDLRRYYKRSQWLHRFMMTGNKIMEVPEYILSGTSRRHFAEELG